MATEIELGKLPPQNIELEEAVLGALMLESTAIERIADEIKSEVFYKDANVKIYAAIQELYSSGQKIDLLTVTEELRKRKELDSVGGPFHITQLTAKVASSAHIEDHVKKIVQKYIARECIRIGSEVVKMAYDESNDVDDVLGYLEKETVQISLKNVKKDPLHIKEAVKETIKNIEKAAASRKENGLTGIPSGMPALDKLTGGWQNSDLIIEAARPSMGKTSKAIYMAVHAAKMGYEVLFFSLEMSFMQLMYKAFSIETGADPNNYRDGKLEEYEWQELDYKINKLVKYPFYIDDTPALSILEFKSKVRRFVTKNDVKIVFIDYLQLMCGDSSSKGNREQEISYISRSLKEVAKECDIPIIALSQLNRSVESRSGDKRPQLSDLRESGAIEQDADIVNFTYRAEYYGITEDDKGNSTINVGENITAKHRNGGVGTTTTNINKYRTIWNTDDIIDINPVNEPDSTIEPNREFDNNPF